MNKWQQVKLNDCCISISDGDHQAPPKSESGIPFVTISNIDSYNSLDFSNVMYVPQSYYDKLDNKRKAQKGDIIYSVVGSFGIPVLIKDDTPFVFQRHIAILKPGDDIDPRFLYYTMLNKDFYHKADAVAIGAAQRTISLTALRNLNIPLPPIEVQRKIADVLSAYDDLIENNRKQIKLLEEAAQRLYKEWFIDLRFPGHETTKIINGIPDGWERKKLIEIADIQYGYAFDGSLFNSDGEGTPIVRIRNIPAGTTDDYTTESADSQYLVKSGDILVGMDGEFHINTWSGESAYLVQRTCRIMPKNADMRGFLLLAIYDPIKFFEKTVVGATVAHLGKKHLDSIELLIPTAPLFKHFQEIFFKRHELMTQNRKLSEARDRLLPKLMTDAHNFAINKNI